MKTSNTFDLANFEADSEVGESMTLYNPSTDSPVLDAEGKEVAITLLGPDSKVFKSCQRAAQNRRLKKRKVKITAEELDSESLEQIVSCTVGWSGIVVDGQALECNRENARALYTRFGWIREQADEFIGDRANFIKN